MIQTQRLILRVPEARDVAALRVIFANPEVMADLAPVKDDEGTAATLAKHDAYRHEGLGFWVSYNRTKSPVSTVTVTIQKI